VGIMAKAPLAGAVKTRLCPPLTAEEARDAAVAMLRDCADATSRTTADLWCVHTGAAGDLAPHLPAGSCLLLQRGDGLAERLAAAQDDLHGEGYHGVILVGADCPTLDADYLRDAVRALDDHEVVLGPATDGGYTLIGSRQPTPELFEVRMSTSQVLQETVARAHEAGHTPHLLAPRSDLDTVGDVLDALEAGWLDQAPRTRALADRLRRLDGYAAS
jgi:uncharacterized protein